MPPSSSAPEQLAAPTSRWWILVIVSCAQIMIVLDATIMYVALPSAQRSLGFSIADRLTGSFASHAYTLTNQAIKKARAGKCHAA